MSNVLYLAGAGLSGGAPALTAPVNDVAPVISGTADMLATLTLATPGSWSGNPTPTLAYNWQSAAADISGQTDETGFAVRVQDAGTTIRIRERATNSEGNADSFSNGIVIPAMVEPPLVDDVLSLTAGATLTLDNVVGDYALLFAFRNFASAYGSTTAPTDGTSDLTPLDAITGNPNVALYERFLTGVDVGLVSGSPVATGQMAVVFRGVRSDIARVVDFPATPSTSATAAFPSLAFDGNRKIALFLVANTVAALTAPAGFTIVANTTHGGSVSRLVIMESDALVDGGFAGTTMALGSSVLWHAGSIAFAGGIV